MKFREFEIKCPDCGASLVFRRRGQTDIYTSEAGEAKWGDMIALECSNKNCYYYRVEMPVPLKLEPSEEAFANAILWRGEGEGYWWVKGCVAGGSGFERTAMGIDFEVQDQRTGVTIQIETKLQAYLIFTASQRYRFRTQQDIPKTALRLCLIMPVQRNLQFVTRVFYWSPKFFRTIPDNAFIPKKGTKHEGLSLAGLEKCIAQNEENARYNVVGGEFGDKGVKYSEFPIEVAYDWLYEKLKQTIKNPLEDRKKRYIPCRVSPLIREIAKDIIFNKLMYSYRPLYPSDFYPDLENGLPERETSRYGKQFFIKKVSGTVYVKERINELRKEGWDILPLEIDGYTPRSYGFGRYRNRYILLTKGASRLLDIMKIVWEELGINDMNLRDMKAVTGMTKRQLEPAIGYRKELEGNNLIKITKEDLYQYLLTEKCIDYFLHIVNNEDL